MVVNWNFIFQNAGRCISIELINVLIIRINDDVLLFAVNQITDLGIVFQREINFHAHLGKVCCKTLGSIKNNLN